MVADARPALELKGNVVSMKAKPKASTLPLKIGDVSKYLEQRTTKTKGASVSWVALYVDYRDVWCKAETAEPVDAKTFGAELDVFRVKCRLRTRTEGKDVFFEGVKLAS